MFIQDIPYVRAYYKKRASKVEAMPFVLHSHFIRLDPRQSKVQSLGGSLKRVKCSSAVP